MNKILKMVGTASLVGSMAMLVGCGGGGGGGSDAPVVPVPDGTQIISAANTTAEARTNFADTFKLIVVDPAADQGYEATISKGFKYGEDKISYTGNLPQVSTGGVNTAIDGKVDLTWVSNGKKSIIHLTDLDTVSEGNLTYSGDTGTNIYVPYSE